MSDTPDRLEAVKNYCDMAIRLERRVMFWNSLTSEAVSKMHELKKRHAQLDKIIKEAQVHLTSLGSLSQQEIEEKKAKIKRHGKYCKVSALCFGLMLIGTFFFFFLQLGERFGDEHGMLLLISLFFGGITLLAGPLLVCIIVFILHKSKQKKLKWEIECIPMQNEERRKRAILSERLNSAEKERKDICNREKILAEQQKELKASENNAIMRREEFYGKGEIPKTYQNLNAMISFFYYLDNKIVDEIEGVNGIYNKYHEDCKHREHMGKLDAIHGAILEHERHEQMRHQELMRTLHLYGTVIAGQLSSINHYSKVNAKIEEARYRDEQEYRRQRVVLNI